MTLWQALTSWWHARSNTGAFLTEEGEKAFRTTDIVESIQADCRNCGRVNQVPGLRFLQKPRCGNCKVPLMPKTRIRIVTTAHSYSHVWHDYEGFWATVAAEYAVPLKKEAN